MIITAQKCKKHGGDMKVSRSLTCEWLEQFIVYTLIVVVIQISSNYKANIVHLDKNFT